MTLRNQLDNFFWLNISRKDPCEVLYNLKTFYSEDGKLIIDNRGLDDAIDGIKDAFNGITSVLDGIVDQVKSTFNDAFDEVTRPFKNLYDDFMYYINYVLIGLAVLVATIITIWIVVNW